MPRPPAVVDTNVVVAGLLTSDPHDPTARILDGMLGRDPGLAVRFLLSVPLLTEYRVVLLRPEVARVHGLDEDELDRLLEELVLNAGIREGDTRTPDAPDELDQHLWELLAAEPDAALVTGDRRLLQSPPDGRSVLSPRSYVDLVTIR